MTAPENPDNPKNELAHLDRELNEAAYYDSFDDEDRETDLEWVEQGPYESIAKADEAVRKALASKGIQSVLPSAMETAIFRDSGYVYLEDRVGFEGEKVNLYVEPEVPTAGNDNEWLRRITICGFAAQLSRAVQDHTQGWSGIYPGFHDPIALYLEGVRDSDKISEDDKHRLTEAAREAVGEDRFTMGSIAVQPPGFTLSNLERRDIARVGREEAERLIVEAVVLETFGTEAQAAKRNSFDQFIAFTQHFGQMIKALDRLEYLTEEGAINAYKEMGMKEEDHESYQEYSRSMGLALQTARSAGIPIETAQETFPMMIRIYRNVRAQGIEGTEE